MEIHLSPKLDKRFAVKLFVTAKFQNQPNQSEPFLEGKFLVQTKEADIAQAVIRAFVCRHH